MTAPTNERWTGRLTLSRMPLRARLVAGFSVAMIVVLSAAGAFVYWRVRVALDAELNHTLDEQRAELESFVDVDGHLRADDPAAQASAAARSRQLLSPSGAVLAAGPGVTGRPLLTPRDVQEVNHHQVVRDGGRLLPASSRPLRLLATRRGANILVVTVARDQRDEALRELLAQLAVAGLGTLIVTAIVGERLAHAALEPVERYRTQAEAIARGATGVRLDVPVGRDDEITRLGHTFNNVLTALESAVDTERLFTQSASHELRTPLTTLSGRVQLTRQRRRSTEEHERALAEMSTDINELIALADQLLALGAADHPRAGCAGPNGTDAVEVARTVASRTPTATLLPPAAAAHVAVPSDQLHQMLSNLVRNAEVHGKPPIDVDVAITPSVEGPLVVLTVHDEGATLAPEFLPGAFGRFQRSDDARSRPGSGLGLALVAALVERNDGELRLCRGADHHSNTNRFDFPCAHRPNGTTATIAFASPGSL